MMHRPTPPPPPIRPERPAVPVDGEAELIERWRRRVVSRARRVHVSRLGMTREDVVQDLITVLIRLARRQVHREGELPSDQLIGCVIRRRIAVLNRAARVPARDMASVEDKGLDPADGTPPVTVAISQAQQQEVLERLVHVLDNRMRDTDMSLLIVRVCDGLEPTDVARTLGIKPQALRNRIYRAKAKARAYLAEIGIRTWADVEERECDK